MKDPERPPIGTKVMVFGPNLTILDPIGIGTYLGDVEIMIEIERDPREPGFQARIPTPYMVLENGEIILGCECWWHPI